MRGYTIVNRGEWLWNRANIKGANKDFKIYVGRSTTVHNLLFSPHTLCMNYVTNTFLLVSSSVRSKQLLCFVHGQGQKREQKHTTKNFDEFHNHSPPLTMVTLRAVHSSATFEQLFRFGATFSPSSNFSDFVQLFSFLNNFLAFLSQFETKNRPFKF